MGKISIEESGMKFREYDERDVFHIETSQQYIETLRDRGVKICEFLLSTDNKIVFVEAKEEWLINVRDDLNSRMNYIMRIWKIQRIMVLNEEMARQKKYIQ